MVRDALMNNFIFTNLSTNEYLRGQKDKTQTILNVELL